ncbi:MAG: polysaccharide biosynthesis/export family protein [Planctomycetota bacterium]|nr:polysaccharide biosynthesis/export family protein [Planctomycetota bacterium]
MKSFSGKILAQCLLWSAMLTAMAAVSGCSEYENTANLPRPTPDMKNPIYPIARAIIKGGDNVSVRFIRHPELDTHGFVEMDGTFSLPILGPVQFADKTTGELRDELIKAYSGELRDADVTIATEKPDAMVFVAGATRAGGPLPYRTNMTVAMAIAASAPDTVKGDLRQTILVRQDSECAEGFKSYLVDGDFASGDAKNVYLMPGDVVIIPRKGIALAGDKVQLYIRDMIPPQMTMGYIFSHEVHREPDR